jgi:hypothetical protein
MNAKMEERAVINSLASDMDAKDQSDSCRFYYAALVALNQLKVPFLLGGGYALERYTGIDRSTKDLDIFVRPEDCHRTLAALSAAGYRTELTYPHWLGKAFLGVDYIDIIFNSGNGIARVDDEWFKHAIEEELLGLSIKLCPAEETIWSKAYIMERERYDGADVAHFLLVCGKKLDWRRLLWRFGPDWRLLLSHIILFGFVYPSERSQIPEWVMSELLRNLEEEMKRPSPVERVCQGTLLSREQYLVDIERWGYKDGRLLPRGNLTEKETDQWTAAIRDK